MIDSRGYFTMENNELFMTQEALENRFESFSSEFDTDMALDNVNPWLLIAIYNNAAVA